MEEAQKRVVKAALPILEEGFDDIVIIARTHGQTTPMIYIKGQDAMESAGMCLWAASEIQAGVQEGSLAK